MPASKRFRREARREIERVRAERAKEAYPSLHPISQHLAKAFDGLMTEARSAADPQYKRALIKARQSVQKALAAVNDAQSMSNR